jgi:hypothetical protein
VAPGRPVRVRADRPSTPRRAICAPRTCAVGDGFGAGGPGRSSSGCAPDRGGGREERARWTRPAPCPGDTGPAAR